MEVPVWTDAADFRVQKTQVFSLKTSGGFGGFFCGLFAQALLDAVAVG